MRRIIALVATLAVLTVAFLIAYPILSGKTTPPSLARDFAVRAIQEAEAAEAAVWAPELLAGAETLLDGALTEYRTQEVRFLPMRDFADAESLLTLAEARAKKAAEEATAKKTDSRSAAETTLAGAERAVDASSALAENIHLSREERSLLNRSRLHMTRAKQRWREGDFPEARRLAESAVNAAEALGNLCSERASRYTQGSLVSSWRRMAQETIAWSRRTGKVAIVVTKANHRLTLYRGGSVAATYSCDIGYNNVNDKLSSGDGATPEGKYSVSQKKGRGQSKYYKALLIDYPNGEDKRNFQEARRKGIIPRGSTPGGLIEVHGEGGRGNDWTKGCVAVTNDQMDVLFRYVEVGTPVTIVGSDGDGGVFAQLVQRFQKATRGRRG
jgi:L,D-peptidoglycan transpeptidase YkuD (ErfK/YbiS/YcfS/YnhG family)